jgi:hypothetical protein
MEWIDHLANLVVALGVIFGGWQSWHNSRAIKRVEHATNSLMDERIVTERKEAVLSERASAAAAVGERTVP